ncbi:MAG: hypothetical protein GXO72_05655, partial [Caldiserica bacterium]|nr:hypothetical protein [Caldisericota bacterium]
LLERLMLEERKLYLEEHPTTKGNGYYTRDLPILFGPIEDLKVPRVREGDLHPNLLPYRRRASLDLAEAVFFALHLGGEHPGHCVVHQGRLRGALLPTRASPASPRWQRRRSRRGRNARWRANTTPFI